MAHAGAGGNTGRASAAPPSSAIRADTESVFSAGAGGGCGADSPLDSELGRSLLACSTLKQLVDA